MKTTVQNQHPSGAMLPLYLNEDIKINGHFCEYLRELYGMYPGGNFTNLDDETLTCDINARFKTNYSVTQIISVRIEYRRLAQNPRCSYSRRRI